MAPLTPTPETETEAPIFEFTPGDLEPIDGIESKEGSSKSKLPAVLTQTWVKHLFRPILFGALGIHALLLFVPLTSVTQSKPKELAEPSKIKRLTDKVASNPMPKVKVTSLPKPALPKVSVASSDPVIIQSITPPTTPPSTLPTTPPATSSTTPPNTPSTNSPTTPPTTPSPTPPTTPPTIQPLPEESQKFATVIVGLRAELNPGEPEADPLPNMLSDQTDIPLYFSGEEARMPSSYISPSNTVESVAANLKSKFDKFNLKSPYGSGQVYEAKIGGTTRYITLIGADGGVMVSLWEKSPVQGRS